MQKIEIQAKTGLSSIFLGESLDNLINYLPQSKVILITDTMVRSLYGKRFPNYPVIEIGVGESIKTLETLSFIYEELMKYEADRSTFIVGIGGGIVCDITGFAASTYMRGLSFGFVSTTLLSQVDASIGGKNGVNYKGFKNMIGVFAQPQFVLCDITMLQTLREREYNAGLAEIVKAALIKDKNFFLFIVGNYSRILQHDPEVVENMIFRSLKIKSDVVIADEKEKGERRKLNFGHTIGHAIEKLSGVIHGEAISLGIVAASMISFKKGLISQKEYDKIVRLLKNLQLPVEIKFDPKAIFEVLQKDKKRENETMHFVLLNGIGDAIVEKMPINELEGYINDLC
jgi:3-dehydroquinate synthase